MQLAGRFRELPLPTKRESFGAQQEHRQLRNLYPKWVEKVRFLDQRCWSLLMLSVEKGSSLEKLGVSWRD